MSRAGETARQPDLSNLATLAGVTLNDGEPADTTAIFHLDTASGRRLHLTLELLVRAIAFLEAEGTIPVLPDHWLSQLENAYGFEI